MVLQSFTLWLTRLLCSFQSSHCVLPKSFWYQFCFILCTLPVVLISDIYLSFIQDSTARNTLEPYIYRKGGRSGASHTCRTCRGCGVKVTYRQLGPGMSQQLQSRCPDCRGEGNVSRLAIVYCRKTAEQFYGDPFACCIHRLLVCQLNPSPFLTRCFIISLPSQSSSPKRQECTTSKGPYFIYCFLDSGHITKASFLVLYCGKSVNYFPA